MNEKFKELSALAQEKLIDPITGEEYYSFSRMKFAELIVRECAEVVKNQYSEDWGKWSNRMIEEHFGVEE